MSRTSGLICPQYIDRRRLTRLLATEASHQMTEEALDFLFDNIIACDDRKLIVDTAHHFADRRSALPAFEPGAGKRRRAPGQSAFYHECG